MTTRDEAIDIRVAEDQHIAGTLVAPRTMIPGMLFVHGWGGSQEQYLARAREIAALGCICLTFDLRGHAETDAQRETVTREDNLHDLVAAYDVLAARPGVDPAAIAVAGSSYGGYLAAILTSLRSVRWLGLRAPALYKDDDWALPKMQLRKPELAAYRRRAVSPDENRALGACTAFQGDVLIVESEHDDVVPHPAVASYMAAFENAHSVTYRVIEGADHGLSEKTWQQAYTSLLVNWATEMVLGARESGSAPAAHTQVRPSPSRGSPKPA
jgi:pimeloyl-ACP methyl ester carboxylesterase